MATEVYRDEFGIITHDDARKVLELQWLESTANMSDDDFMQWLELYVVIGEEHRTPFMIIDARQFRHRPGAHVWPWREERIIPRYNNVGVKKFAFLLLAGAGPASEPAPEGAAVFPTGYFDSRDGIDAWFDS